MTLHVLEPGLCTLVVDAGRPHTRSLGVPVSGAADRVALAVGNALVGNDPATAALEITLAGPTLRADCDLACVVYGAPFSLSCGMRTLTPGKTFTLHADETLRIGGARSGLRGYLCIAGGIAAPVVLDSRSALQPVRSGDVLPCRLGTTPGRSVDIAWTWDPDVNAGQRVLRVVDGPQASWFDLADVVGPPAPPFTVSSASNRMGLRLQGAPVRLPARELVSEPVCPGAIQATRDGQLIVLGVDGQTIGGYPKIAQVISADLDALGQLRPGETITFRRVSLEEAETLYRRKQAELQRWLLRIRIALSASAPPGERGQ